ncbi:MAG: DNA-directed RNA polymerase subunit omega [Kiritimatiellae bacterium]|nr:DNA-directed RNA polymerase subunit omega [Kiritimatiellia bacterium]
MDIELLKQAHEQVKSVPVLVNLISKRVKQLINGEKPLVRPLSSDEDKVDTALREVALGKLISEIDFDAIARAEDAKTRWQKHAASKSIYVI